MVQRLDPPLAVDYAFTATLGVDVEGELWSAIAVPDSASVFGSLRSVRVDATVDGIPIDDIGLMPTGSGQLMLSISAALRKKLGKELGASVDTFILRRLT